MPLVFVHGVNVRSGPDYTQEVKARDALFRRFALSTTTSDPDAVTILNPYWGDYAAKFYWDYASLPPSNVEVFGTENELAALLLSTSLGNHMPTDETVLLEVAQSSVEEAIDLLWAMSNAHITDEQSAGTLAALAVRAIDYAKHNPQPSWLGSVTNDQQFLNELINAVDDWKSEHVAAPEQFGLDKTWDQVREGALRISSTAGRLTSQVLVTALRSSLHKQASCFLGDAFVYLTKRGTKDHPGPIVTTILKDLEGARQHVSSNDQKLVVVTHSMGGNILYDILSYFRPDFNVDILVTVGSQVAMFEELKLFLASDPKLPTAPGDRVSKPANVGCWLNVFDEIDTLGFATTGVFQDTNDFRYSTGRGLIMAHSSYFTFPSFHQRLAERLRSTCP